MTWLRELFIVFATDSVLNLFNVAFLRYCVIDRPSTALLSRFLKLDPASTRTTGMQSAIIFSGTLATQNILVTDVRSKHVSVMMMNQARIPRLSLSQSHCLAFASVVNRRFVFVGQTCRQ